MHLAIKDVAPTAKPLPNPITMKNRGFVNPSAARALGQDQQPIYYQQGCKP